MIVGRRWVWPLAQAALIFALSAQPGDAYPDVSFPLADKIVHFGLYGPLGAGLVYALGGRPLLCGVMAGLYGVSDEWHQSFVPLRTPDAGDVAADLAGGLVGAFVFQAWWAFRRRRSQARR